MTVYKLLDGQLVEKPERSAPATRTGFPIPFVSRFEAYDSPVDGKPISSWRQRDADMKSVDAVDRRDIPERAFEQRKQRVERDARATRD